MPPWKTRVCHTAQDKADAKEKGTGPIGQVCYTKTEYFHNDVLIPSEQVEEKLIKGYALLIFSFLKKKNQIM